MTTYLKYRPAWMQLFVFGSLIIGFLVVAQFIAVPVICKMYGISPLDLININFTNPGMLSALKALQAVTSIAFFLLPSLVFAYLSDKNALKYIGFKKPVPYVFFIVAIVIIIASFPMVSWLIDVNQHLHLPKSMQHAEKIMRDLEDKENDMVKNLLNMKSVKDLIGVLLLVAVLPAIAEELFFRGVLQRLFIQIFKRPWAGIITVAIIFSAMHGQFLGFFPRLVLGIVLGTLYWYSGSLWPGIIGHFMYNGLQVLLIYNNPQMAEKDPNFSAQLIAFSTIAVVALIWWMQRISHTRYGEVYDTDDFHIGPRDQYMV